MSTHSNTPLPQRDKQGYLINLDDWNEEVADTIAKEEHITLNEDHWEIIRLLRQFYATYELSPAMRIFVKYVKEQLGDEQGNSIYLMTLFPGSPAKLAAKISGLPKPTNCL